KGAARPPATKATICTGAQRPDLSRRNGMGHARSNAGENTGRRDNAQSNAARPAVIGNHDLTRADGISAAPACKPKPAIGCGSARRCPGLVNFRFAARTPDEAGLLDCPRYTPYKGQQ